MTFTNFSKSKPIPSVSTRKTAPSTTNFAKGIFTYKPNDTMDYDEIYLAQNARFDRIGEYKTRRGLGFMMEPIGKSKVAGTVDITANYDYIAVQDASLTLNATSPIYSLKLALKTLNSTNYGILQAALVDTEGNTVAVSCSNSISTTPGVVELIFKDGPTGTLELKLSTQGIGTAEFLVGCPTGTTTPAYEYYTATEGKVTNLFEANIDGDYSLLFTFKTAAGTALYRLDSSNNLTKLRDLPADVEHVRFSQNVNKIRYADGKEGPRLIDPANSWSDTAISTTDLTTGVDLAINTSNILSGTQDNLIYFDADTTTQAIWTYPYGFQYAKEADYETATSIKEYNPETTQTQVLNTSTLKPISDTHLIADIAINDYIIDANGNYAKVTAISGANITVESISHVAEPINTYDGFDRDFRQNFPAIQTGDPLTAMFNLGGVVYFLTRRNKYYMYSQTADVWSQQTSSAQHGTFTQESTVCDLNYAYYANDDGIYIFDGSSEASLTQNTIQSTYDAITGKESITLELYNNRLYVFYSSQGNGKNDSCLVYNINLKLWESFDTGLPVSATVGRKTASNRFICGSSCFGQLYSFETTTNDYADLGAPIDFDLETSYLHFGTPSQLHRITKWRPEFAKVDGDYTIKCGYALDFTDYVKYAYSINLKNQTPIQESYVWDNPRTYGNVVTPTKLTTIPQVNGQFYRCQIRYQHHSAYEPVLFKAMTLSVETQRLR